VCVKGEVLFTQWKVQEGEKHARVVNLGNLKGIFDEHNGSFRQTFASMKKNGKLLLAYMI